VSFAHLGAVAKLILPAGPKLVLYQLADLACDTCGLAWPGLSYLIEHTGMQSRSVSGALASLRNTGHVVVHRYATGGRGRSTEYVVLPGLMKLSPAPCGECGKRLKTTRQAQGNDGEPSTTREVSGGLSTNPARDPGRNPARRAGHTVTTPTLSGATDRAKSEDPSGPNVGGAETRRERARQMIADLAQAKAFPVASKQPETTENR
jgi:hypothetical protein